jgi:DNA-binding transcriptional ArsR family regulator
VSEVLDRIARLEERVGRLEHDKGPPRAARDGLWALEALRGRRGAPFESDGVAGSLVYAGIVNAPGTGTVVWQEEHPLPVTLQDDWSEAAGALSALAHPVRLEIVRLLLRGARTTQELAEIPDLGTSGQLYHHLRELQAAGLVTQRRRNDYAVPADRVVLCLILVTAARSCAHVAPEGEMPA